MLTHGLAVMSCLSAFRSPRLWMLAWMLPILVTQAWTVNQWWTILLIAPAPGLGFHEIVKPDRLKVVESEGGVRVLVSDDRQDAQTNWQASIWHTPLSPMPAACLINPFVNARGEKTQDGFVDLGNQP